MSWYPSGYATLGVNAPAQGFSGSGVATTPQLDESVAVTYSTSGWNFTLGYQWAQAWIGAVNLPTRTFGPLTLGGSICPCNFQLSGVLLGVGKTF